MSIAFNGPEKVTFQVYTSEVTGMRPLSSGAFEVSSFKDEQEAMLAAFLYADTIKHHCDRVEVRRESSKVVYLDSSLSWDDPDYPAELLTPEQRDALAERRYEQQYLPR